MGGPCLAHPPPWLFLGWGTQGVIAEMGTGGPEMAGQVPRTLQSPSPAQSQGGCAAGPGQGTGVPDPQLPVPNGQRPASPTEPESHAQHEKGEEKVTITTPATTSPRGKDHLTATRHTTGGREDGEQSLVGLGTENRCWSTEGDTDTAAPRLLRGSCCWDFSLLTGHGHLRSGCPSWGLWLCVGSRAGVRLSPHLCHAQALPTPLPARLQPPLSPQQGTAQEVGELRVRSSHPAFSTS